MAFKFGKPAGVGLLTLAAALTAQAAWAQGPSGPQPGAAAPPSAQPDSGSVGEVVVTARQRAEQLQDVPAAVTAFTAANIEARGIERPRDFIQSVPNVQLVETQNVGTTFVVVRGISQARNSEPSVAVVIDGETLTNPTAFNQELYDIEQIEVLKGPQGALYGRDAIGGAILITTKAPTDHWTGGAKVGAGNGGSYKFQGDISGPLNGDGTLRSRTAVSVTGWNGYIQNTYLNKKADPFVEYSARERLVWAPNTAFSADLRLSLDRLRTHALYFNIVNPPDPNNTSLPVRVNNPGTNHRDLADASLKLSYDTGMGTLSSVTAFNSSREVLTGDAFDFLPIRQSLFFNILGFDLNQSQFLKVQYYSEELRMTSPTGQRLRWIAGLYGLGTNRFISTGNMVDTGAGVFPVYKAPTTNPSNPQATFLSDTQHNFAWAAYADFSYDVTNQVEFSANFRYDEDHRKNRTDTPTAFLPSAAAVSGQVREHTWSGFQPQFILRYKPDADLSLYASASRGFRSGGFNQTGVGAVAAASGFANVGDLFKAETAQTFEAGFKAQALDRRLSLNGAVYSTISKNGYFFIFLAANSTQNLGNIDRVRYQGFELDGTAKLGGGFTANASFGYTDSDVRKYPLASRIGQDAPLVSRYTFNAGLQYQRDLGDGMDITLRGDYSRVGRTYFWELDNVTPNIVSRDPIDLVDVRATLRKGGLAFSLWSKNLNNQIYNAEYSPGGFVFKALPRRWGAELAARF